MLKIDKKILDIDNIIYENIELIIGNNKTRGFICKRILVTRLL